MSSSMALVLSSILCSIMSRSGSMLLLQERPYHPGNLFFKLGSFMSQRCSIANWKDLPSIPIPLFKAQFEAEFIVDVYNCISHFLNL